MFTFLGSYLRIIIIILLFCEFFIPALTDVFFYGSLNDSKSLKSPGLFSVFWSILLMLLSVWSPLVLWFLSLLVLLPVLYKFVTSAPVTIGITVTFKFHSFFLVL